MRRFHSCGSLALWALFALSSFLRADILVVPGPSAVQMKAGAWAKEKLTAVLPLVSPPEWGKTVAKETRGEIRHYPKAKGEWRTRLRVESLLPSHFYTFTLNGRPDLPGNALLPDTVPGLPDERYYDFLSFQTDEKGHYEADVAVVLKPGTYQVRLYVKDRADFKIVLYQDYFPFRVD